MLIGENRVVIEGSKFFLLCFKQSGCCKLQLLHLYSSICVLYTCPHVYISTSSTHVNIYFNTQLGLLQKQSSIWHWHYTLLVLGWPELFVNLYDFALYTLSQYKTLSITGTRMFLFSSFSLLQAVNILTDFFPIKYWPKYCLLPNFVIQTLFKLQKSCDNILPFIIFHTVLRVASWKQQMHNI